MNEPERFLKLVQEAPKNKSSTRLSLLLLFGIFALGFVLGALWVHETQIVLPARTKMFVRP